MTKALITRSFFPCYARGHGSKWRPFIVVSYTCNDLWILILTYHLIGRRPSRASRLYPYKAPISDQLQQTKK
jgi:hypothetical protein